MGNDLSNDVLARQIAAICVNDEPLFPDVVYHTTARWLLVFHITGDLTVTLKFGPVATGFLATQAPTTPCAGSLISQYHPLTAAAAQKQLSISPGACFPYNTAKTPAIFRDRLEIRRKVFFDPRR